MVIFPHNQLLLQPWQAPVCAGICYETVTTPSKATFYYNPTSMQYGTVKFFHNTKKFGFITTDEGDDVFFHITGIVSGGEDEYGRQRAKFIPVEGERVQFTIVDSERGPKAINVDRAEIDTREGGSEDDDDEEE